MASKNGNIINGHDKSLQTNHHAATLAMHADDDLNRSADVAPAMHLSTTFRNAEDPAQLKKIKEWTVSTLKLLIVISPCTTLLYSLKIKQDR